MEQHGHRRLLSELGRLDERIALYDQHISQIARQDCRAKQLMRLRGVGEITATAMLAMVGNGHDFKNGRQFAAWLGLVPGQHSSGGKARLGHVTKAGDGYMRSLLVLGARSMLNKAKSKTDAVSRWAIALAERRGYWREIVAIAAKNARMAGQFCLVGKTSLCPHDVGSNCKPATKDSNPN